MYQAVGAEGGSAMTDSDFVLEMVDVSRHFPVRSPVLRRPVGQVTAVDGVSIQVRRSETVALVGESGSGKSTLGRMALRLLPVSGGRVLLNGSDISGLSKRDLREARRNGQMVFQDPYSSLDPHATIRNSLAEPLDVHSDLSSRETNARIAELLDMVHMSRTYVDRYPHEFSGGQLQRVALARALAMRPSLIVADEPLSSLDVSTQAQMLRLLRELQTEKGIAYLFVSHDLSVVNTISDRIAVMYLGRIVESGTPNDVIKNPRHPYTQALVSAVPRSTFNSESARTRIILRGDPPSPTSIPSGCRFHTRCHAVMDICSRVDPPASNPAPGVTVHCHLYPPEPIKGVLPTAGVASGTDA
jgi:oligopeptide transport system ATP-binding protein